MIELLPLFAAVFAVAFGGVVVVRRSVPAIESSPRWIVALAGVLPLVVLMFAR
jgi:hypothetical protein